MRLVVYVHQNPQKHKFENDFRDWNYSSYHYSDPLPASPKYDIESSHVNKNLASDLGEVPKAVGVQRDRMMQLFGSKEDFIRIHREIQPLEDLEDED